MSRKSRERLTANQVVNHFIAYLEYIEMIDCILLSEPKTGKEIKQMVAAIVIERLSLDTKIDLLEQEDLT